MTLCTHMWNILQFLGWLNFANEHVEYKNGAVSLDLHRLLARHNVTSL